eukprot:TRINITY_DN1772_c0_g1_i2.p1 TRINITY_DN1772_c0_g1~~TRINITY_DN1772_c0_g1_i2.p1  ORF type:complete len:777 (+),score=158.80 TRINITY_DN1772_c0_g1_i2:32-2332(+)
MPESPRHIWKSQFGRDRPLRLCTLFAVDKNRKLMLLQKYKDGDADNLEGRVDVLTLDVQSSLVEQWENMDPKPDVIVSKLHKALGSRGEEVHDNTMRRFDELMAKHKEEFDELNIIPIESEHCLVDRYNMVALLKKMANIVHTANAGVGCAVPSWLNYAKSAPADPSDLPPFPIVVKPKSTAIKKMGLVFDVAGLKHFCNSSDCEDYSLEQYIPHSGVVYKIYVIARHIFVGGRPSLPDVNSCEPDELDRFAAEIKGEHVNEKETGGKGYIIFYSDVITNRQGAIACKRINDPELKAQHLHAATVDTFRVAIELEWNIELFGFDVLVDKNDQTHYVVDCNVLPGYKGTPDFLGHMNKLFIRQGIRRGLKMDISKLNQNDLAVKSFCAEKIASWKSASVKHDELVVRRLVDRRVFQVKLPKGTRPDVKDCRKVLMAFYSWEKPRRIIHDEINFIGNVSQGLFEAGVGPEQYCDIHAKYYGCERHMGRIEEWVKGVTLLKSLKKPDTNIPAVFRCLGDSIARFHKTIENEKFKKNVIDHHFQKLDGEPLCYTLLEIWRRYSIIVVEKSTLAATEVWGEFHKSFMSISTNIEDIKKRVHSKLKSKYSTRMVYSHFDVNLGNAIVDDNTNPTTCTLIDIEWSGPSLAVYDFAKLISSLELQIQRKEIDISMDTAKEVIANVAKAYLSGVGAFEQLSEDQQKSELEDFISDCWTFVPIACIINVYSNLIHASFDGQLKNITSSLELGTRGDQFNWLRHARDHNEIFQKYSQ